MECIIVIRERFAGLKFVDFTQWSFSRENFHDILCLNHLNNAIIQSLIVYINEYSQKTLTVLLKTTKTWKFSPVSLFTFTVFTKYVLSGNNIPSISRAVVCNPILEILKVFIRSFQDASGFFSSQNRSIFVARFLSLGCSVPIASKTSSSSFSASTNSNPTSNQIGAIGATTYRFKYLRVGRSEPKKKIACYLYYALKNINENTICNHMVDFNN